MRFNCWFLLVCFISASPSVWCFNTSLLDELTVMCEKDQRARFAVINSDDWSEEKVGIVEAIDRENLPRLKAIIDQFGWPGCQLVGEQGADKIWLLVQHCDQDLEFQKACLELLREAVTKGDAPKRHLAYLTDRVLVNEGRFQLYGTQVQLIDGQAMPHPIQEPEELDKRRKEMELEPFADYLALLRRVYHFSE